MRVTQLLEILERDLVTNGDRNIYYLSERDFYEITYLGAGLDDTESHFWLTADAALILSPGETEEDFRAPAYRTPLILVK